MENIAPHDLLKYWQKGKPIKGAIWNYCDKELIEQYEQIQLPEIGSNNDYSIQNALTGIQNLSQHQTNSKNALNALYINLSNKILSEKLIAIGYKSPIESDDLTIIPHHMWPPDKVDIDNSSISANNIEYVRVRIIRKPRIKKSVIKPASDKKEIDLSDIEIKANRAGRPSIKELLVEAYEYLEAKGLIDYDKTFKAHVPFIQQTVLIIHPEITSTVGMSYKTISRHLSKRFHSSH